MKLKRSIRMPLGFLAGILFIWRADPTLLSFCTGVAVIFFGEMIRFVSAGTLKKHKGVISQNGIYAYTRNPLYIGSFLLGTGACIMSRDILFSVLFFVLYILIYNRLIESEEKFLLKKNGEEYRQYLEKVPRIFPGDLNITYIFSETSAAGAFNNREWKTLLGIAFLLVVITAKMIY